MAIFPFNSHKNLVTVEVLRAFITRPSSHSWVSDSDHIPPSSQPAAAAWKELPLGQRPSQLHACVCPWESGEGQWKLPEELVWGVVLKEGTVSRTFQRKNPSQEQSQAPGWTTAQSSGWRKIQSPFQGSCEMEHDVGDHVPASPATCFVMRLCSELHTGSTEHRYCSALSGAERKGGWDEPRKC